MVTAGLLLRLQRGAPVMELTCRLAGHPAFSPASVEGNWLPVVMEAGDKEESRVLHERLAALPGDVCECCAGRLRRNASLFVLK